MHQPLTLKEYTLGFSESGSQDVATNAKFIPQLAVQIESSGLFLKMIILMTVHSNKKDTFKQYTFCF